MADKIEDIKCYDVDEVRTDSNNKLIQYLIRFRAC
jgi:hypothetical protein